MAESTSLAGPYKLLSGRLSNAVYKGAAVQLRIEGSVLQYKYDDEDDNAWTDLVDLKYITNYEDLLNKPTINGKEIVGEIQGEFVTPSDIISNFELEEMLS